MLVWLQLEVLWGKLASFPGPAQLSIAYSMVKRGEPGIFSHVSDIKTDEKLMNVGRLILNGVIAHALVPMHEISAKMIQEFVCFKLRADPFGFRAMYFCWWPKIGKREQSARLTGCPSAEHSISCWVKEAAKWDVWMVSNFHGHRHLYIYDSVAVVV